MKTELKRKWLFYHDEDDDYSFIIEANDPCEAFDKAYDEYGPMAKEMYYKEI